MKRREALKRTTWILKSVICAPGVLMALEGCRNEKSLPEELQVLSPAEDSLVKAISDTIIPPTETPGASEVGVNRFLDLLLKDVFDEPVVRRFLKGLAAFDEDCRSATSSSFVKLNQTERNNYLLVVDKEIMGNDYEDTVPFYYTFKHLATTIYFSTEEGMKQNLDYQPVPGPYQGQVELKPGDRIMIGNSM